MSKEALIKQTKILLVLLGVIFLIGYCMFHEPKQDRYIEKKIAVKLAEDYNDINDNPITKVTFYKRPEYSGDANMNRYYEVYVNNHPEWKATISVSYRKKSLSIWADNRDYLKTRKTKNDAQNLTIVYWGDE